MRLLLGVLLWGRSSASKEFVSWDTNDIALWNFGVSQCSRCILSYDNLKCAGGVPNSNDDDDIYLYLHLNDDTITYPRCVLDDGTLEHNPEIVRLFDSVELPGCDAQKKGDLWITENAAGCAPFAKRIIVPRASKYVEIGGNRLYITKDLNADSLPQATGWQACTQPGLINIRPKHLGASCEWHTSAINTYHLSCLPHEFENVSFQILPRDPNARIEVNDRPLIVGEDGANLHLIDVPPFPWRNNVTKQVDSTPQWMEWIDDFNSPNGILRVDVGCGCPAHDGNTAAMEAKFPSILNIEVQKLPKAKASLDKLAIDGCALHPEFNPLVFQYVVICDDRDYVHLTAETDQGLLINNRILALEKTDFKIAVYRNAPTTTTFKVISEAPMSKCKTTDECISVYGPNSICSPEETCRRLYGTYSIATIGGSTFDSRAGMLLRNPETGNLMTNYAKVVPTFDGKTMPEHGPPHMSFDCKRCGQCIVNQPLQKFDNMNLRSCLQKCRENPLCKYISHSYPICRLSSECAEAPEGIGRWTRYHACRADRPIGLPAPIPRAPGTVAFFGQPGTQDCIIDVTLLDKLDLPKVNQHLSAQVTCLPGMQEATLYFTGKGVNAADFVCDNGKVTPIQMDEFDTPLGTGTIAVVYRIAPNHEEGESQTIFDTKTPQCRGKHQSFSFKFMRTDTKREWMERKLNDGLAPRCRSAQLLNLRHDYPVTSSSPEPQDCTMEPSYFDPSVKNYKMNCPAEVTSVSFAIIVEDPSARILVGGEPIDSDEIQWHVAQKDNPLGAEFAYNSRLMFSSSGSAESKTLDVTVSCENREELYSIELQRGLAMKPEIVALTIEEGDGCKMKPSEWKASVLEYDIYCPQPTTWITLHPRVADQSSHMLVNDEIVAAGGELDAIELDYGGTHTWNIELAPPEGYEDQSTITYVITAHRAAPIGLSVDSTKVMATVFSVVGISLAVMSGANFMEVAKFLQFLGLMVAIHGTPQGFCMFAKSFSSLNLQFGHVDKIIPALKKYMPFDVDKFKKQAAMAAGLPSEAVKAILEQEKNLADSSGATDGLEDVKALKKEAEERLAKMQEIQKRYKKQYEQYKKNFAKAKKQFMKQKSLLINLFLLPGILTLLLIYYGIVHLLKSFKLCGYRQGTAQVRVNEFRPSFLLLFILDIGLIGFIRSSTEIYFKGAKIEILVPLGSQMLHVSPDKKTMEDFVLLLFLLYPVGFLAFSLYNLHTMRQRIVYNKNLGKYVDRECVEIKAVQDVPFLGMLGNFLARWNFALHYNITQVSPVKWILNSSGKRIFSENEKESIPEIGVTVEKRRDNSIWLFKYGTDMILEPDTRNGGNMTFDEFMKPGAPNSKGIAETAIAEVKCICWEDRKTEKVKYDYSHTLEQKGIQYIRKIILHAKHITLTRGGEEHNFYLPKNDKNLGGILRKFSMSLYKSLEEGVAHEENDEEKKKAVDDREEIGFDVSLPPGANREEVGENFDVRVVVGAGKKACSFDSKLLPASNEGREREVVFPSTQGKAPESTTYDSTWQWDQKKKEEKEPSDKDRYYKVKIEDERDAVADVRVNYKVDDDGANESKHLLHRVYLEDALMRSFFSRFKCWETRSPLPERGSKPLERDEKDFECPDAPSGTPAGWFVRRIAWKDIPSNVSGDALDHVSSVALTGFSSCKSNQSQLILLLRDDENSVHGKLRIVCMPKPNDTSGVCHKAAKEWTDIKGPESTYALGVQNAIRAWLSSAASTATMEKKQKMEEEGEDEEEEAVSESNIQIKTWALKRGGKIEFQFSILLPKYAHESASGYSTRSDEFLTQMKAYFGDDKRHSDLWSALHSQGFDHLKDDDKVDVKTHMDLIISLTNDDKDERGGLKMTNIKEQDVVIKRMKNTRARFEIVKEHDESAVVKNACANDRLELWLRGPAMEETQVELQFTKALFTANKGTHTQQKTVRVCLDSKVFRGEQELHCRARVQEPNDLIRMSEGAKDGGYQPLSEDDDDRIMLMKGMSPAGVPYRLSPIFDDWPEAQVGTKMFPISVLAQSKTGTYGYRLVSNIQVKEIPRLHLFCPDYEIDVPQDQLAFPASDKWSHYYGGMKQNQRMSWFVSRAILLSSICLVAFYGSFKAHIEHQISHTKDLIKETVDHQVEAAKSEVEHEVHAMEKSLHKAAHQEVKDEGNGFDQGVALLVGTCLVFSIAAYSEIAAKYTEKEDDRKKEQKDQDGKSVGFSFANRGQIWAYYTRPDNRWFVFETIWEGQAFMYFMEVILLLVLLIGMDGPMHLIWKDLSSYLLILIAGYTIFLVNIRFMAKKLDQFWEYIQGLGEKLETMRDDTIETITNIPTMICDKIQGVIDQGKAMADWFLVAVPEMGATVIDTITTACGWLKTSAATCNKAIEQVKESTPLLSEDDVEAQGPVTHNGSSSPLKRGRDAYKNLLDLSENQNNSMTGRCKNLFCRRSSLDDLPIEVAAKERHRFQDHVEVHKELLTSWHKGDTVFNTTPEAEFKSLHVGKGEHKIIPDAREDNESTGKLTPDIEMALLGLDAAAPNDLFDVREVVFESVDVIVDSIGLKLNAYMIPDKHANVPRKRLARIRGGVGTTRDDLAKRLPIQLEYEDFVNKFSTPRTLVATIQVVNCARVKNVDKPENDSFLSLYTSNELQMKPQILAEECAKWFLQILNWAEKQGAETIRPSILNDVLDALFWGYRPHNKEPGVGGDATHKSLLQRYLAKKIDVGDERRELLDFLVDGNAKEPEWPGFRRFFDGRRPNYVGEIVKCLQKVSVKPELLHVVIGAEHMRSKVKGVGTLNPYLWNPPMIQAIQAEKFEITPKAIGIGAPGLLRMLGDKFTFVKPAPVNEEGGACGVPITEEIKFSCIQSILAKDKPQVGKGGEMIPGDTLYVLPYNGPVIAFVLSKENVIMWKALVERFGLDQPKPSIFGHAGPTIRHPTEAGVRLRHGVSGSQTWYTTRQSLTHSATNATGGGFAKRDMVKDSAPGFNFPLDESIASDVLATAEANNSMGGVFGDEGKDMNKSSTNPALNSSIARIAKETGKDEDRSDRIQKGKYEGGWSLHKYHDAGAVYRYEYGTNLGKEANFLDYLNYDWNIDPKFQREICIYEGLWKNGLRHGKGTLFFPIKNKWYFFDGLFHEGSALFGYLGLLQDDGSFSFAIEDFTGFMRNLDVNYTHDERAEFPWLSPVEMFVALTHFATDGATAEKVEKMSMGEIMHKLKMKWEESKQKAKESGDPSATAALWNKKLKESGTEDTELTPFDTFCLDALLDHVHVIPTVDACLEGRREGKGKKEDKAENSQKGLVLSQKLPLNPVNELKGDPEFLRACLKIWFQFDGPCFEPPALSVDENDKKRSTMEVLKYLPKNAPVSAIKHAIGASKNAGNVDKEINIELKKKFGYNAYGELPAGKDKIMTGIMSEDWDAHKARIRELQIKYTAMMRLAGDYGLEYSEQVADSLQMPRRLSTLSYGAASTVSIKGNPVQDAMDDELNLELYQFETDGWVQGAALVSLQPEILTGYIRFRKNKKIGCFEGMIQNGEVCEGWRADMEWNGKPINSGINGRCRLAHNKATYEGECKDGKREGKGKHTMGSYKYDGEWKNDVRNGEGSLDTISFSMKGTFVDDKPTAFEEYKVKDQKGANFKCTNHAEHESSTFEFLLNESTVTATRLGVVDTSDKLIAYTDAKSVMKDPKGKVIYSGEVKDHIFEGQGHFTFPDFMYKGALKDGMRQGKGKLEFKSGKYKGSSWNGDWTKDKPSNEGSLKFVFNGDDNGVYQVKLDGGPPSKKNLKPPRPIPCCTGQYDLTCKHLVDLFGSMPKTPHIPGGERGSSNKGFAFNILDQCAAPQFDVAEATAMPEKLLHVFLTEIRNEQNEMCHPSLDGAHELTRNKIVNTLPYVHEEYRVSFDVFVREIKENLEWQSILHLSIGENCKVPGDRIPGVWLNKNGRLHVASAVNGKTNHVYNTPSAFPLNKWVSIVVEQKRIEEDYFYTITVDGEQLHSVQNNKGVRRYEDVKVYAGDPWYEPANGYIRNLKTTNAMTPEDLEHISEEGSEEE